MSSSRQQQSTPASTSATEELSRFAHYVEFRTRGLRQAAANYLVTTPATNEQTAGDHGEDNDTEPLFVDVEGSNDGWVGLTEEAVDVPEDTSQQIYHEPPPPPPGPIQQTTLATQRAALQALGLTGTYLEFGLRLVAEDVGWMMHTASVEEALRGLRERFPLLVRLGESYGRGARAERERRLSELGSGEEGRSSKGLVREGGEGVRAGGDAGGRVGELEEVLLVDEGEGDEEWDALYGETYAVGGR